MHAPNSKQHRDATPRHPESAPSRPDPAPHTPDATPAATPAAQFAAHLLAALVARGVTDVVLSPGSRSQALALAAAALERDGHVRLHVRIDERSAAFFALGIARETGVPAPLIVTSGTAVANTLPAALEAHHAMVPFLLLSADRPEELRGIRSPQTTQQAAIFGSASRLSIDEPAPSSNETAAQRATTLAHAAVAAALGTHTRNPGPVQLNLAFREPLSGGVLAPDTLAAIARAQHTAMVDAVASTPQSAATQPAHPAPPACGPLFEQYRCDAKPLSVVIAGAGAGPGAEAFAHEAGLPLLAEVTSGARFGRNVVGHYRELLSQRELGGAIERVFIFGQPSLSREVPELLGRPGIEVIVVAPLGNEFYTPHRRATAITRSIEIDDRYRNDYAAHGRSAWLRDWVLEDRACFERDTTVHQPDTHQARKTGYKERSAFAKAELEATKAPITRAHLAESLWLATWPHDRLVLGASRLPRVLDGLVRGRNIRVHANRGLAGIDGTIATARGVAQASQALGSPGITRVLLGDLTLAHDAGSLLLTPGEMPERMQVFVGNDNGGSIFEALEVAHTAPEALFQRALRTPFDLNLTAVAAAYGWMAHTITTRGELAAALAQRVQGPQLIDVRLGE